MLILGLESSCDETAAAVVEDGVRVRSSVVASQTALHAEYAGVVPEIASRAHVEAVVPVVREAVARAGVSLADVGAVAVGHRPGLIGSLVVGVTAAKALAWSLGVPLVGVDHVHAHLYSGALRDDADTASNEPRAELFPALGLVVSGGHTTLYRVRSWLDVTRLGSTIDDAVGEAYDKAAAILGVPFPGGPNLDRLAQTPGANERAAELPISRLSPTSLDFSFSGLKTALLYEVQGVPGPGPGGSVRPAPPALTDARRADLAASFQRAAVRAVLLKVERALERLSSNGEPARAILTGGGVTANSRLRAELASLARDRAVALALPRMEYCIDNAAMIAGLGYHLLRAGRASGLDLEAVPTTAC